ncbi:MAG: VWA domain-containing protein [Planctomycetota bacterium]|nr:MAG: VWA domain-containing protein [Planctomycetota bacterium]
MHTTQHRRDSRQCSPTRRCRQRRGAVIVLVAILLPVMIILAGFTINGALIQLRKTEMYVAADAAARAGGRELGVEQSESKAIARAQEFAARNKVGGVPVDLKPSDIVFGQSDRSGTSRYNFDPNGQFRNAMQVHVKRDGSHAGGPVPLLFPMPGVVSSVELGQSSISTQVQVDVCLVIDRSGSMAYASNETAQYPPAPKSAPPGWDFCDPAPPASRWLDLVQAVQVFDQALQDSPAVEFASLVTYADTAVIEQPLTTNYSLLENSLNKYTNSFCAGGTNIGGGILVGMNALAKNVPGRSGAIKVLLVMTDGKHNSGLDPVAAAKIAGKQNVMIFTVTFSNETDEARMKLVAKEGQGEHFHAKNGNELQDVFKKIAARLPVLLTE